VFFSETDFHLQRHAAERRWGLAMSLALAAHIVLFVLAIYLPSLFDNRVIREEVVSVSLVSMSGESAPAGAEGATESSPPPVAEPIESPPEPVAPPAEPPPPPPPPPPSPPEPIPVPVPVPPEPVVAPAPPEPVATAAPVSLVAEKRKVKVAQDTRLEEEKVREQAVTRQQEDRELARRIEERQRQVEQRRQAEQQQEIARREAERQQEAVRREAERQRAIAAQADQERRRAEEERRRAEEELRRLRAEADAAAVAALAARTAVARETQAVQDALNRPSSGRQQAQSAVGDQYTASVVQRVRSYWILPEMRSWDTTLLAQVVITINKEGEVLRIQFEQRSRDPLFDQMVERTIRSASPMPRFPAIMQQETMEVGFNFKPGELGNM
jgi:colicin import membrane protein